MLKRKSIYEFKIKRERVLEFAETDTMSNPKNVAGFLKAIELHKEDQERVVALCLDSKNRIWSYYTVSIGTINRAPMSMREVFRGAISVGASSIIIAHCHPSGNPSPSNADLRINKTLVEASEILDIQILDNVIVGEEGFFSFQEEGLMDG